MAVPNYTYPWSQVPGTTGYQPQFNTIGYQAQASSGSSSTVVMVSGESGANNYPVAAGNTVLLMDFESKQFWLKSTDINGFPQPLRSFNFSETTQKNQNGTEKEETQYVTKKEFDELKRLLEDLTK